MSRRQQIEQLLAANPKDAFLLFALAKEDEKAGDDQAALTAYERVRTADPEYVGLFYHLAKTLERLERPAEAWKVYTEGISIAKRKGEDHAMRELAGARLELGDEEDFV